MAFQYRGISLPSRISKEYAHFSVVPVMRYGSSQFWANFPWEAFLFLILALQRTRSPTMNFLGITLELYLNYACCLTATSFTWATSLPYSNRSKSSNCVGPFASSWNVSVSPKSSLISIAITAVAQYVSQKSDFSVVEWGGGPCNVPNFHS